jgi:hypothetical protein
MLQHFCSTPSYIIILALTNCRSALKLELLQLAEVKDNPPSLYSCAARYSLYPLYYVAPALATCTRDSTIICYLHI